MEKKSIIFLIIFIIVGAIAGITLYYYLLLFKKEPILGEEVREILRRAQQARRRAVLILVSKENQYVVNDDVVIDIYLDSQENLVDGVDLVLKYDPQFLQLEEREFFDTTGSIFNGFPDAKIDEAIGQIRISAITSPGNSFQGVGKIGSLYFKAKKNGQTTVSFVFEKGSTIDSNVSSYTYPGDILALVKNVALKIY